MQSRLLVAGLAAAAAMLIGCGTESSTSADEPTRTVVTVVKEVQAPASDKPAREVRAREKPVRQPKAARISVPDVVGMGHQEAQNRLQAAGLYMLDEVDATGQGRMLLWDRNWVVVEQDPPAGTEVTEDDTITLASKKIGE